MNDLLRKLPWLPWVGGFAVVATLLVTFHRMLGLSLLLVVIALVILALIIAIVLLVKQLRTAAAAEEIENTLSTQADADIEKSTPGQLAEITQLKENLLAAIQQLKASGGKAGDDALARLPWYMVIGPAGAGKSELIKRSGLEFVLKDSKNDARAVRGVGGTRGFSWWLANEAVLLDMAGKTLATAAFDDSGDWVAFLGTLRKQRPEKPLHGVLVVVAVDQLADQPESRIDSVARAARERLQELVQHLGVVFPVYVVFNRADQVAGFGEFFEDMPQEDRRAPWGATISIERARANPADQLFEEEYGVLLGSLSERRLPRMAAMPETTTRARAFAFPLQMERVRGSLRRFVRTLFDQQGNAEAPLLRGFYFSAAAQEGEPTDRVLQPAVRTLGLKVRAPEGFAPATGGSWFVRNLFTEVVFPDAGLAVTSKGAEGQLKRSERVLIGSFGIAWIVLTAMFAGFSCMNGALVTRAKKDAVEVANRVQPDAPIVENLRALEPLRASAAILDSVKAKKPFLRSMGGYSGDVVRDPAVTLWMRKATESVLALAARQMETDLRQLTETKSGSFLDYYYLFRAWRLLSDPTQIQEADAPVIASQVEKALAGRLTMGSASQADRREYPELVRRQVVFLSRHPKEFAAVAREFYQTSDPSLVERASNRVRETWDTSQFYAAMLDDASHDLKPVTFASLVGNTTLMSGSSEVRGAFTKKGWIAAVKPRVDSYRRMVTRDWLLRDIFHGPAPDLATDVAQLYAKDYSGAWVAFVDGVQIAPPASLGASAEQIAQLQKGDSPLFKALRAVGEQTQLGEAPDSPLGRVQSDFTLFRQFFESKGNAAEKTANLLGGMLKKKGDALDKNQAPSAIYQGLLKAAQAKINEAGQPAAPTSAILALYKRGEDESNPLHQVVDYAQSWAEGYPGAAGAQPMAELLAAPITILTGGGAGRGGGRGVVGGDGGGGGTLLAKRISEAFQESEFVGAYKSTLAGKYPFAASATDASIDDFAACFGPSGSFWTFYKDKLSDLVKEDGSPKGPGSSGISPSMTEFLRKAYAIRQAFFAAGDQPSLTFTVSTETPRVDPPGSVLVRQVVFDCGGENALYTMGPRNDETLHWPGADPTAGASIRALAAPPEDPKAKKRKKNEPAPTVTVEAIRGEGPWGLFRLLDRASSVSESGSGANVAWVLTAGSSKVHVVWQMRGNTANHPFKRGFLRMSLPGGP